MQVVGLRALQGALRDHVVGVEFTTYFNKEGVGSKGAMFWFDVFALTTGLYYLDVLLDVKQLLLFAHQGLKDYLALNLLGMMIPIVVTFWEGMAWIQTPSPEQDYFIRLLPQKPLQILLIMSAILTQTHILLLAFWSARFRD